MATERSYNNILETVVNTPEPEGQSPIADDKQVAENIRTIVENGELPSGTDVEGIMAQALQGNQEIAQETSQLQSGIARIVSNVQGQMEEVDSIVDTLLSKQESVAKAQESLTETEGELAAIDLVSDIEAEDRFAEFTESINSQSRELNADLGDSVERLLENYKIVEKSNDRNFFSYLFQGEPLQFFKDRMAAERAQEDIPVITNRIQTIDAAQTAMANEWQNKADRLKVQTSLRRMDQIKLHQARDEKARILQLSQAQRDLAAGELENAKEIWNLNTSALQTMTQGINALRQKNQLTSDALDNLIKTAQLETYRLNIDKARDAAERDEQVRGLFNKGLRQFVNTFNLQEAFQGEEITLEGFERGVNNGLIPPDVANLASGYIMSQEGLTARGIFESDTPFQDYSAAQNLNPAVVPEGVKRVVSMVESWEDSSGNDFSEALGGEAAIRNLNADPESKMQAYNQRIQHIWEDIQRDAEPLFKNMPGNLHAPRNIEKWEVVDGTIQGDALEELKTWRANTSSFSEYTSDLLANAVNSDQPAETLATNIGAFMQHHLDAVNTSTGFGLESLNTRTLGGLDATNPSNWYQRILKLRARRRAAVQNIESGEAFSRSNF